jgi:ABC-type transport system substrate-binding protein
VSRPVAAERAVPLRRWGRVLGAGVCVAGLALASACSSSANSSGPSGSGSSPGSNPGSGSAPANVTNGGSLTVGLEADWGSIDPLTAGAISSQDVAYAVFDTLLTVQPDGTLKPSLAESYTASPDAMTYTLKLRPGVTFQDGTPFDAAAVKFNLLRVADPKNACPCIADVSPLKSVDTPDSMTVVINLSIPDEAFPTAVLAASAGMMASPTAVQSEGKDFGTHPVGAGPFKFDSEVASNTVTLKAWPGYWDAANRHLDSVTFKVLTDEQARFASLQSGAIQVAENVSATSLKQAQGAAGLTVQDLGALGTNFVAFDMSKPPFNDVRARQAVTYATNPAVIDSALYGGIYDQPLESPWP